MIKLMYMLAAIGIWHILSLNNSINFFISSPFDTVVYTSENTSTLLRAFVITLAEASFGLISAIILSYLFAIASTAYPPLLHPTKSLFVVTQVLPIITLAPLFIALLGMGVWSKIAMVCLMCFFPIFMSLVAGISAVRAEADDFLSMYSVPLKYRLRRVYLPLALPHVFVGFKVAATMAVLGAIVAEFLGAYYGLGKNLYRAPKLADAELMMASAILTALMGMAIFRAIEFFERRLVKWET